MADSTYRARKGAQSESVADTGRRTILVVEDDAVLVRQLEQTLAKGGYRVETAQEAAGALGILGNTLIDLVLTDLYLPDMDGFQLFRRVRRESRFRGIPVLFMSSDNRLATKVVSLEMGVDDYMVKPIDAAELKARVDAAVRRLDASRAAFQQRRYNLAGDFTGMSFPDLTNLLDLGRRTGVLSLVTPRAAGEIRIREGRVLYARFGNLEGEEAVYAVLGESEGLFEFAPGAVESVEGVEPMTASCTALLMEGARRVDTSKILDKFDGVGAASGLAVPAEAPAVSSDLAPALASDPMIALDLVDGVSDPFMLGELQLLNADSLKEFTLLQTWKERLHALLVADPDTGISSMTALAAPLTDRQIASTLREAVRTVALVFTLRKERLLDVVLADQAAPSAHVDSMRRRPAFVILAPRNGDFLSLSVEAQVGLVALLQRVRPLALLGVGNASMGQGIDELQVRAGTSIPVRLMRSSLDQAGADLRDILLEGIGIWAEQAPAMEGMA